MARSDLLVALVKAANSGDRPIVRKTVEAMAAEERAKNHLILAQQLESELQPAPRPEVLPIRSAHQPELLVELTPRKTLAALFTCSLVRLPRHFHVQFGAQAYI